jgi:SAM-dependent methyltransferase
LSGLAGLEARLARKKRSEQMAKQGEIAYLEAIGEAGIRHAVNKPFSDVNCAGYLMEIGAIIELLPPPPATLLDVGCGTGWTSIFFARHGYQVTGLDIAKDMIFHANVSKQRNKLDNVRFLVGDYEEMTFDGEFDGVVFYDSLHHAMDEGLAIRMAYRALKPGGLCVTSEPGHFHAKGEGSLKAVKAFNVTEKDMPCRKVMALAREAGFQEVRRYPHAHEWGQRVYGVRGPFAGRTGLIIAICRFFASYLRRDAGITLMRK